MTDHYILVARGLQVVVLFLVAYLVACGVNALLDWVFKNWRE